MPGRRRTHEYPHGKPFPLVLLDIAMCIVVVSWLVLYSHGWLYIFGILAVMVMLGAIASKLTRRYERTGLAVRIPQVVSVELTNGMPAPIRALRGAFFVLVAALLFFGLGPLPSTVARRCMIGSILGLFAVGGTHFFLERHYLKTGRAEERYDNH